MLNIKITLSEICIDQQEQTFYNCNNTEKWREKREDYIRQDRRTFEEGDRSTTEPNLQICERAPQGLGQSA